MNARYWLLPKSAKSNPGKAWWYANERGAIQIYTDGAAKITIQAKALRKFLAMLDKRKKP